MSALLPLALFCSPKDCSEFCFAWCRCSRIFNHDVNFVNFILQSSVLQLIDNLMLFTLFQRSDALPSSETSEGLITVINCALQSGIGALRPSPHPLLAPLPSPLLLRPPRSPLTKRA